MTGFRDSHHWGTALLVLMGSLLLLTAGSFLFAVRHPSPVVDPHYYSHGLRYGREGGEAPWRLEAALTPDALDIRVVDAAGAPVTGGTVQCRVEGAGGVPFAEALPGVYRTSRRTLPRGDLRAAVRVSKGSAHCSRRMVVIE